VLMATLQPTHRISPASPYVVLGQFARQGRRILLVVNVGREAYQGHLTADAATTWQLMDPASGTIQPVTADGAGNIRLSLAPRQAILLVRG